MYLHGSFKKIRELQERSSRRASGTTTTLEAAKEFKRPLRGFILMSLEKTLKDPKLERSFKNWVNLDNSRQLARASATTLTPSLTTTCCESAASELLQVLLRLFGA